MSIGSSSLKQLQLQIHSISTDCRELITNIGNKAGPNNMLDIWAFFQKKFQTSWSYSTNLDYI